MSNIEDEEFQDGTNHGNVLQNEHGQENRTNDYVDGVDKNHLPSNLPDNNNSEDVEVKNNDLFQKQINESEQIHKDENKEKLDSGKKAIEKTEKKLRKLKKEKTELEKRSDPEWQEKIIKRHRKESFQSYLIMCELSGASDEEKLNPQKILEQYFSNYDSLLGEEGVADAIISETTRTYNLSDDAETKEKIKSLLEEGGQESLDKAQEKMKKLLQEVKDKDKKAEKDEINKNREKLENIVEKTIWLNFLNECIEHEISILDELAIMKFLKKELSKEQVDEIIGKAKGKSKYREFIALIKRWEKAKQ